MKLSKETKEFIFKLLERELDAEYIQDNDNPEEVEYLQDLIKASKEYSQNLGFPYNEIIRISIDKLKKEVK